LVIDKNYTEMHGQWNIKNHTMLCYSIHFIIHMVMYSDNLCDPEHNFRN